MRKSFYLFSILIISYQCGYCQKNAIKGFIFPPFTISDGIYFVSFSVGYERLISSNSSLGLTLNIWAIQLNNDEYAFDNILLDYKKYIKNENSSILNNCFGNIYSVVSFNNASLNGSCKGFEEGITYTGTHFGLGIGGGKKIYLTKKLMIDFGAGSALTYIFYSDYSLGPVCGVGNKKYDIKWIPRLILLIGYNF